MRESHDVVSCHDFFRKQLHAAWFLSGVGAGAAFLGNSCGPGLHGEIGGLDVGSKIHEVFGAGNLPDAGKIGMAVGAVRCRGGEIDLALFGTGDAGGRELRPLRGG